MKLAPALVSTLLLGLAPALVGCVAGDLSTGDPNPDLGGPEGEEPEPEPTPTPTPTGDGRVTDGLVARWNFSEGTGTQVVDVVGGYNLEINNPANVEWIPGGGLNIATNTVEDPTALSNPQPATQVISACKASNSITVEAWMRTNSVNQNGPARIVTNSPDQNARNFTLGQDDLLANGRLRTSDNDNTETLTNAPAMSGQIDHLVYTRGAIAAEGTVWLNGEIAGILDVPGDFSTWSDDYPITMANETSLNRPWRGELYLVAIYCRALNATEVNQNLDAGF